MKNKKPMIIGMIFALVGFGIQWFGMIAFRLDPIWMLTSPYDRTTLALVTVFCGLLFIMGYCIGCVYLLENDDGCET